MPDIPDLPEQDKDRTETARRHDDRDLIESMEAAPSAQGRSGGTTAADVATRDEEKRALDPDAGVTGVHGADKQQPFIPTRADNDGANG